MKNKLTLCALLLAAMPALVAAQPSAAKISDLARTTGLTERQVQMVVGGHTAYAEYLTQYDWAHRKFVKSLGQERYRDLMAGRTILLDNGQRFALAKND